VDGSVKKVAHATYLFCPSNMEISGDLQALAGETESYV
jgi:FtsZ-interacting cell division protein YlmF